MLNKRDVIGPLGSNKPVIGNSKILDSATQLAKTSRISPIDKPILAAGLGRLAAMINHEKPLDGAKSIYKEAWGESWEANWPKRKRLMRLPDEEAEASRSDNYTSRGTQYVKAAEAAAKLLKQGAVPSDADLESAMRELLLGSSYLPQVAPLSAASLTAYELLERWEERLIKGVESTRLSELLDILKAAPFTTETLSNSADRVEILLEPAGKEALGASRIAGQRWREGTSLRFSQKTPSTTFWASPLMRLGRIASLQTIPTFIIPPEIASTLGEDLIFSPFSDSSRLPSAAREWFDSIGAYSNEDGCELISLPDHSWSEDSSYGWIDKDYFRIGSVYLEISQNQQGKFIITIECGLSPWDDAIIPTHEINREYFLRNYFNHSKHPDFATLDWLSEDDSLHRWPSWAETAGDQGGLIGIIRIDDIINGPFETPLSGRLKDEEIQSLLFEEGLYFYPNFSVSNNPVPCQPDSIAAALLRNLNSSPEGRLVSDIVVDLANDIADAGILYNQALLAYYSGAIDRI